MGFSLRIEEDDAELIISTMADALRAANKDADKYHDMNEQTGSERYHQISVLTRILSRQSDDVLTYSRHFRQAQVWDSKSKCSKALRRLSHDRRKFSASTEGLYRTFP